MDYAGPAELEWRANATFVMTASIQVEAMAYDDAWRVRALPTTKNDQWGLLVVNHKPVRAPLS